MKKFSRCVLILLLVTVLGAVGGYFYSDYTLKPMYSSTAELYVVPDESSEASLRDKDGGLNNDFEKIIKSATVITEARKSLGTSEDIGDYLSVETPPSSNVVRIICTNPDSGTAKDYVDAVARAAVENISKTIPVKSVQLLSEGDAGGYAYKPDLYLYTAVIAAMAAGICLILEILVLLCMSAFKKKPDDSDDEVEYERRYGNLVPIGNIIYTTGLPDKNLMGISSRRPDDLSNDDIEEEPEESEPKAAQPEEKHKKAKKREVQKEETYTAKDGGDQDGEDVLASEEPDIAKENKAEAQHRAEVQAGDRAKVNTESKPTAGSADMISNPAPQEPAPQPVSQPMQAGLYSQPVSQSQAQPYPQPESQPWQMPQFQAQPIQTEPVTRPQAQPMQAGPYSQPAPQSVTQPQAQPMQPQAVWTEPVQQQSAAVWPYPQPESQPQPTPQPQAQPAPQSVSQPQVQPMQPQAVWTEPVQPESQPQQISQFQAQPASQQSVTQPQSQPIQAEPVSRLQAQPMQAEPERITNIDPLVQEIMEDAMKNVGKAAEEAEAVKETAQEEYGYQAETVIEAAPYYESSFGGGGTDEESSELIGIEEAEEEEKPKRHSLLRPKAGGSPLTAPASKAEKAEKAGETKKERQKSKIIGIIRK